MPDERTEEQKSKGIESILQDGALFPNAPEIYKLPKEQIGQKPWELDFFKNTTKEYVKLNSTDSPIPLYIALFGGDEEAAQKAQALYANATGAQNSTALNSFREDLAQKLGLYTINHVSPLIENLKENQDALNRQGFQRALIGYALDIVPKTDTENTNADYNEAKQAIENAMQENQRIMQNPQQYLEEKLQNASDGMKAFASAFSQQILQDYQTLNINKAIDKIQEKVGGLTEFTKLTIELAKEQTESSEKLNKTQAALQFALRAYNEFVQQDSQQQNSSESSEE